MLLWIAFKNYYLRDEGQLSFLFSYFFHRCELLSKIIIFVMKDNQSYKNGEPDKVVNCFQKLLSSWWRTTLMKLLILTTQLWIAFKNYYLRDEGQRCHLKEWRKISCELLSKIIIFVMKDNCESVEVVIYCVVNCFQKLLSSWWRTTFPIKMFSFSRLWIAFKNYYLRDEGQQIIVNRQQKVDTI